MKNANILYKQSIYLLNEIAEIENVESYISVNNKTYDQIYGTGSWLIVDPNALPADFSTDTYTIENGKLVKASQEVIAERLRIKALAQRESIRTQREARYNSEEKLVTTAKRLALYTGIGSRAETQTIKLNGLKQKTPYAKSCRIQTRKEVENERDTKY